MALTAAPLTPALAQAALIVAKSTLLLAVAGLGARAMRRASAAARHLVWSLALGGLMALPALALVVPDWKPAALAVLSPTLPNGGLWGTPASPALSLETILLAAWAAGAFVVLARLVRGLAAAGRLARGAEVVSDPAWTDLLERLGRAAGVRRAVVLLRSPEAAMPLTWGAFRPAILLPAAADAWDAERRRVVLLHELAHVARRDCLMQTLAELCCAAWWFHPGAWWAAREMRSEREQACDDLVLATGARASDYAGHLLDVARTCRVPMAAAAIGMARPSHLEGRVRAVLAAGGDRRAVNGRTAVVCAGTVLLAVLPLAAVTPSERPVPPQAAAWEMPPARTQRPEFHGSVIVTRPARVAAAPVRHHAKPAKARTETPRPAPSAVAQRTAAPERSHPRRERPTARVEAPGLLASLDANGNLHARVRLPRGVEVRAEGHGVRAVGNELRVDLNVSRAVSLLAQGEQGTAPKCPRAARQARTESRTETRKLAAVVRRRVSEEKHDLGLRILAGVNGEAEAEGHAAKAGEDESAGGA
ncbi:MAG TPA: M56 family metallopeptidase [Longimicrobium sp.]|nr:M56 family metallopeptidase [Longimicrobium sp.]